MNRMAEQFSKSTIHDFLAATADKTPAPGGGAVSALIAALGAATAEMAARFTTGGKYSGVENRVLPLIQRIKAIRNAFKDLIDADAAAFDAVGKAYEMPKSTPAEKAGRKAAIAGALSKAAEIPEKMLMKCSELSVVLEELEPLCNPRLAGDVGVAAAAIKAAALGAWLNIDGNLKGDEHISRKSEAALNVSRIIASTDAVFSASQNKVRDTGN
jgi:methenyltetrahydrofolate cyclohydrolase